MLITMITDRITSPMFTLDCLASHSVIDRGIVYRTFATSIQAIVNMDRSHFGLYRSIGTRLDP